MLCIMTIDDIKNEEDGISLHIEDFSSFRAKVFSDWIHQVAEIQADGHELQAIKDLLPTLPIPNKPVVRFFAETARYILGNL